MHPIAARGSGGKARVQVGDMPGQGVSVCLLFRQRQTQQQIVIAGIAGQQRLHFGPALPAEQKIRPRGFEISVVRTGRPPGAQSLLGQVGITAQLAASPRLAQTQALTPWLSGAWGAAVATALRPAAAGR